MKKLKIQQIFKFKKNYKIIPKGYENKNNFIQKGSFGLKVLETKNLFFKEIESAFKILLKKLKKKGFIFIKGLPFFSATKQPLEVRMGKGKGNPSVLYLPVKSGLILFEIFSKTKKEFYIGRVKKIFKIVSKRLSVKTKIVKLKF